MESDDDADLDGYTWRLFLNFTADHRIWINCDQLRYLRDELTMKSDANKELVDQLVVFREDGKYELGPYLQMLTQQKSVNQIGFAKQYEWTVSRGELQTLREGGYGRNGLVNKWWHYNVDDDPTQRVTFGSRMVMGYGDAERGGDDAKEEEEVEREKSVGFIWRLSDSNKFKSLMVSVELWCPDIAYYVQFWNVQMSASNDPKYGVSDSGNTDLFPLSELERSGNDAFHWTVILKAYAVH